jgi:hypothetical protein
MRTVGGVMSVGNMKIQDSHIFRCTPDANCRWHAVTPKYEDPGLSYFPQCRWREVSPKYEDAGLSYLLFVICCCKTKLCSGRGYWNPRLGFKLWHYLYLGLEHVLKVSYMVEFWQSVLYSHNAQQDHLGGVAGHSMHNIDGRLGQLCTCLSSFLAFWSDHGCGCSRFILICNHTLVPLWHTVDMGGLDGHVHVYAYLLTSYLFSQPD